MTSNGPAATAEREGALRYAQTERYSPRMFTPSLRPILPTKYTSRSEKEARKFNTKLLQRQTALESQVEQLTNELKVLKQERRSDSLSSTPALSPTASQAFDQSNEHSYSRPSASNDQDRDNEHTGETGGVLRLQKDGESIYIGAGGSSWALQQVRFLLHSRYGDQF